MHYFRKIVIAGLTMLIAVMALICISGFLNREEPALEMTEEAEIYSSEPVIPAETAVTEVLQAEEYLMVPRLFQTDYPYIKYGNGTIGTSGCSITSLAMGATYLTDHAYRPDELAYHFGSYGVNNIQRLEYGCEQMHLAYEKQDNWKDTLCALKAGKVAIVLENQRSPFTTSQHFIVLAGLTEDGKIIVNDPYGPNYEDPYLKQGFDHGFGEYDVVSGYSGAWVFDKSAMPEDPFLYNAEKPELPETRYTGVEPTGEDIYDLACFAWAEAREEPFEVQQAVLEVVLNRIVSKDFPNTVRSVIFADDLYHAAQNIKYVEEPNLEQYCAVTAALYGPHILPKDVVYYSRWSVKGKIWGEIGDYVFFYSR